MIIIFADVLIKLGSLWNDHCRCGGLWPLQLEGNLTGMVFLLTHRHNDMTCTLVKGGGGKCLDMVIGFPFLSF